MKLELADRSTAIWMVSPGSHAPLLLPWPVEQLSLASKPSKRMVPVPLGSEPGTKRVPVLPGSSQSFIRVSAEAPSKPTANLP